MLANRITNMFIALALGITISTSSLADDFFPEEEDTFFSENTYDDLMESEKESLSFSEWWRHFKIISRDSGERVEESSREDYRRFYDRGCYPEDALEGDC